MAFSNSEFVENPLLMENPISVNGSPSHSSADAIPQQETFGVDDHQIQDEDGDWKFFKTLPPGYRFCPTDSDLIVHYLMKKIEKKKLPRNQIRHINLYQYSPEKIAETYEPVGDKEWYFFTPRDRKYRNGFRPNRAAGSGYWKATGADKNISYKGKDVGCRKALVYYEGKPPKGSKTNWIMHEYRTDTGPKEKTRERMEKAREKLMRENAGSTDMRLDDFVLCRIYKKVDKSFKPRPRNAEEDASPLDDYIDQDGAGLYQDGVGMFDEPKNDYLHIDDDFKSTDFMQSNGFGGFNGLGDFHHHSLSINYGVKPFYLRQPLFPDEDSLDVKPSRGGFFDNTLWSNCDVHSLPPPEDLSVHELDNLLNSTYEIPSMNAVDGPSMPNR